MTDPVTVTETDRAAAKAIWTFHQLGHRLRRCSVAVGLGSHDLGVPVFAAELHREGLFEYLVFSGADNPMRAEHFPRGEAVHFKERAVELGVPAGAILVEPRARNTGQNIAFSRALLEEVGIETTSVMLIAMPYMQRRAYATCQQVWPEVEVVCASEPTPFESYVQAIGEESFVIDQLVGDLQRVIEYPRLGFAVEQDVPGHVLAAFTLLCERGYTSRLLP